ncbi:hypothetical protein FQN60_016448 [Etheostoma spectabile]|uniref:Uncharacterized protein n=1 Tax=Etheostoma spectabile TaxID=54343 RepID=A0A5J5D4H6_9PERO|nr:hypothetical protein FQN60_016448 [Etheostoma spectabile]
MIGGQDDAGNVNESKMEKRKRRTSSRLSQTQTKHQDISVPFTKLSTSHVKSKKAQCFFVARVMGSLVSAVTRGQKILDIINDTTLSSGLDLSSAVEVRTQQPSTATLSSRLVVFVFGVKSLQQGSQDVPRDLLVLVYQRLNCLLHLQSNSTAVYVGVIRDGITEEEERVGLITEQSLAHSSRGNPQQVTTPQSPHALFLRTVDHTEHLQQ